eukprot:7177422-Prymnesium_polylepis.1
MLVDHASGRDALLPARSPPPLTRMNTTIHNSERPPAARWRVLSLASMVAFLQGSSFATFSMMVGTSLKLFPILNDDIIPWTLNCNNITQVPCLCNPRIRGTALRDFLRAVSCRPPHAMLLRL